MLGRSKLDRKRSAPCRCRRWTISSRVRMSAVAVSAMRGTCGNSSASWPSCRYSGRKSWPHCDTQWASSMANNEISRSRRKSSMRGCTRRSGARYSIFTSPRRRRPARSRCCSGVSVEFSAAAGTPSSSSVATWSSISAISGETTTVKPGRSSPGTWKHNDLPPPVGISTRASPPLATQSMIAAWRPRKLS
ncbi:hypothetical protein D3C78_1334370 [compost metagenome]